MELLEQVISDAGYWSCWTISDNIFQVEFGGTQLNCSKGSDTEPPSHQLALRFENPACIAFVQRDLLDVDYPDDWMELLKNDEIEPFNITYEDFTLTDWNEFKRISVEAAKTKVIIGDKECETLSKGNEFFLAFWAGNVGLTLVANDMVVVSHEGELSNERIVSMNNDFWEYWKKYWKKRGTKKALPEDYICEVTIPAG